MLKFAQALQKKNMGYVYRMAIRSDEMLDATLEMNTSAMEQIWEETHDVEIPLLQYNNEDSLSCVVTLVYLNARDTYRIEREEKTGKGYADFIFHPQREGDPAIILELKKDSSPQAALKQIHEKNYLQKVKDCEQILLAGITYDSRTKKHHVCMECIKRDD